MGLNYKLYDKKKAKKRIAAYLWKRYLMNCDDYTFKASQIARELPYSATYISRIVKEWTCLLYLVLLA